MKLSHRLQRPGQKWSHKSSPRLQPASSPKRFTFTSYRGGYCLLSPLMRFFIASGFTPLSLSLCLTHTDTEGRERERKKKATERTVFVAPFLAIKCAMMTALIKHVLPLTKNKSYKLFTPTSTNNNSPRSVEGIGEGLCVFRGRGMVKLSDDDEIQKSKKRFCGLCLQEYVD